MPTLPVPKKLLPADADWSSARRRTYMISEHPSVIIEQVCYQIEAFWGPTFVAGFLRRLADRFDERQKVFEEYQNESVDA